MKQARKIEEMASRAGRWSLLACLATGSVLLLAVCSLASGLPSDLVVEEAEEGGVGGGFGLLHSGSTSRARISPRLMFAIGNIGGKSLGARGTGNKRATGPQILPDGCTVYGGVATVQGASNITLPEARLWVQSLKLQSGAPAPAEDDREWASRSMHPAHA